MAKLALLVPQQDMLDHARRVEDRYRLEIAYRRVIETGETETAVRELEALGADLVIARGLQAAIVGRCSRLPLVNIKLTGQDIGFLLQQAKETLGVVKPRIGLVAYSQMVRSLSRYDLLFDIQLEFCPLEDFASSREAVEWTAARGVQLVIGGSEACRCAGELGLPSLYAASGTESIEDAFRDAELLGYAIDNEKRNTAEIDAMLGSTMSGILQVDRERRVRRVNSFVEDLLGRQGAELTGRAVNELFPTLSMEKLQNALEQGVQAYSVTTQINNMDMVTNIEPILIGEEIQGAVITLQEGRRIYEIEAELRKELYSRGYVAKHRFEDLRHHSQRFAALVEGARRIAEYHVPLLLEGEEGTEKDVLAQCIHNAGSRRKNSFIDLECAAWEPQTLGELLFGVRGEEDRGYTARSLCELAEEGTLFLDNIDALGDEMQYKIYRLIGGQLFLNGENRPLPARVRVLAGVRANPAALVREGRLRADLYYALNLMSLRVPPLRERREDIPLLAVELVGEYGKLHARPVHLTKGACDCLADFDWPGNLTQLRNLCQRLVLLTQRRSIDEVLVRRQLEQLDPVIQVDQGRETVVVYRDRGAVEIVESLKRNGGNRIKTAEELGISKTTLWRRMKKYGIGPDLTL